MGEATNVAGGTDTDIDIEHYKCEVVMEEEEGEEVQDKDVSHGGKEGIHRGGEEGRRNGEGNQESR